MNKKKILKDIVTLVVLEAIVVGVLFFFSNLAHGDAKLSPNVVFDVSQSMINSNTKYIGVYTQGNKKTEIEAPEIPGYYCICKNDVEKTSEETNNNTLQFEFSDEQTSVLKDNKNDKIIIVFMNENDGITLKSQTINLKIIPHVRDISLVYLSNTGIEMNYTYNTKEITIAAVVLTFIFYAYHVISRNREEKEAVNSVKAES